MKIKFLGAATSVTGSCHLITTKKHKMLLDCGQFQGSDESEDWNSDPFDFDPTSIDFVLLSHAHIDHSGRLPLLVKRGFTGPIYCTDATADLLEVMLRDSGHIHEKEAEWKNRKRQRAGKELIEPLYTIADAEESLKFVEPLLYNQQIEINGDIKVVFNDAGHILGSAIIEVFIKEEEEFTKLVYSGDIGVRDRPILRDPTIIKKADFVVMEATYGDRVHEENEVSIDSLIDITVKTIKRGGTVVIPSFAVGRTQELIYEFNHFYEDHSECKEILDTVNIYVDSPMATSATDVFRRNASVFDAEMKEYILKGDHPLDFKNLIFTRSTEESKALNANSDPKVIISASGMCEAGRIKHHLKHHLWDPKSSIVFVGYQANGTLGRSILQGDKNVSIFGEKIRVAAEIYNLEGFSGHADQHGLLEWVGGFQKAPHEIFLVHGEEEAKNTLAELIKETYGYPCTAVQGVSEYILTKRGVEGKKEPEGAAASKESIRQIKDKIVSIHDDLEAILYNTQLAISGTLSPDQAMDINNVVLDLEKSTLNLGSLVSMSRHSYEMPEAEEILEGLEE